jgi:arylsulfatase A-like enzyme
LLGCDISDDIDGVSHAPSVTNSQQDVAARSAVFSTKTYHDSFDPIRAIRTKEYSYIENYAHRPLLDLPWDIEESAPGQLVGPTATAPRPERELYDLIADPTETRNLLIGQVSAEHEAVARDLALQLNDWRVKTNDVIPSEFAGTRIAERYTQTYAHIKGLKLPSRSAIAEERGINSSTQQ